MSTQQPRAQSNGTNNNDRNGAAGKRKRRADEVPGKARSNGKGPSGKVQKRSPKKKSKASPGSRDEFLSQLRSG